MVATFARLKLHLLRNAFRSTRHAIVLVLGALAVAAGVPIVWIILGALNSYQDWAQPVLIVGSAGLLTAWLVLPLTVGFTDGSVDPSRLAHLPITDIQMATGLATAASIGLMPLGTLAGLAGVLLLAPSVPMALLMIVLVVGLTAQCVVLSQLASMVMSSLFRGLRSKDLAASILAALSMAFAITAQLLVRSAPDLDVSRVAGVAGIARWTPGGWAGWGLSAATQGRAGPALAALVSVLTFTALLAWVWVVTVRRTLVKPEGRSPAGNKKRERWPTFSILTSIPSVPARTAAAKTLMMLRRDPRALVTASSQIPLLLVFGLPAISQVTSREQTSVMLAATIGIYGGVLNTNLFGLDGRSSWIDLTATPSIKPILWGKTAAHGLLVLPIFALTTLGLATWTGGWALVPSTIGLAVAGFGALTCVHAIVSTVFPAPIPEGFNQWAGNGNGSGLISAVVVVIATILGLAVALPALLLMLWLVSYDPVAGLVGSTLPLLWGAWIWSKGINIAARPVDRQLSRLHEPLSAV